MLLLLRAPYFVFLRCPPQKKEDLEQEEEYAVERLCSWLARVQGADPLLDEALDDAQREFLLSYRLPEPGADSTHSAAPPRQYILPQRTPRNGGAGDAGANGGCAALAAAGEPSRGHSEEAEAVNDPELQAMLRAVSVQLATGSRVGLAAVGPCCEAGSPVCQRCGGTRGDACGLVRPACLSALPSSLASLPPHPFPTLLCSWRTGKDLTSSVLRSSPTGGRCRRWLWRCCASGGWWAGWACRRTACAASWRTWRKRTTPTTRTTTACTLRT